MGKDQYEYGRTKEQRVAQHLRNKGASVKLSKGSKGAADLHVKFSTGTKWEVQVKSSRSSEVAMPSPKDLGRIKQSATKKRATPVIAQVTPKGVVFKSARSGRTLKATRTKRK